MIVMKPGILVSLKTSVAGGVTYQRTDLDDQKVGSSETRRWETVKTVDNVDDFMRAGAVRGEASALIRKPCIKSAFGLICLSADEDELEKAINEAMRMCDNYNRSGTNLSNVRVNVLRGRIADNDAEAARGIAQEITDLLEQMKTGVANFDVRTIREAAGKAREVARVLGNQEAEIVSNAVAAARKAARTIAKRIEKGGEEALVVFRDLQLGPIDIARFAFMDPEEQVKQDASLAAPAINIQRFSEIDADQVHDAEQNGESSSMPLLDFAPADETETVNLSSLYARDIDGLETEVP